MIEQYNMNSTDYELKHLINKYRQEVFGNICSHCDDGAFFDKLTLIEAEWYIDRYLEKHQIFYLGVHHIAPDGYVFCKYQVPWKKEINICSPTPTRLYSKIIWALIKANPNNTTQNIKEHVEESEYRIALADAICSPKGVIPDSANNILSHDELNDAEIKKKKND